MVKTFLRNIYKSFVTDIIDVPPRLLAFMLFLLLIFVPLAQIGPTYLFILTLANIVAIFAASWDLLVGRTGQISLGHALFFGIGAYTTAMLGQMRLPLWVTVPLAMLLCVTAALLVGFPCLRVKGPYLALISMGFPLILLNIFLMSSLNPVTGGASGIGGVRTFFPSLDIYQRAVAEYLLTLLVLLVSGITLYKVANSRIGIVMVSILDDDLASKACGINVTKYKLLAFAISALFASLAGTLYAHIVGIAGPSSLSLTNSFLPLIMTILGGIGTIYGPITGAIILQVLDRYVLARPKLWILGARILPLSYELHMLIFMILVVIFIIKWPRGIASFVTDKLTDLSEEREIEERGRHIWKKYKRKKESTHEG